MMKWFRLQISGIPPSGRSYHSSCVIDKKIYIFGGYDGETRSNDIFILEKVMPTLKRLCIIFIKSNLHKVGNLSILPYDLQEAIGD